MTNEERHQTVLWLSKHPLKEKLKAELLRKSLARFHSLAYNYVLITCIAEAANTALLEYFNYERLREE